MTELKVNEVYAEQPNENGNPVLLGTCASQNIIFSDLFLQVRYLISPDKVLSFEEMMDRQMVIGLLGTATYKIGYIVIRTPIVSNDDVKAVLIVSPTDDDPSHLRDWCAAYHG